MTYLDSPAATPSFSFLPAGLFRHHIIRLLILLLLYPWIVGFDSGDTLRTSVGIAIGAGSYDRVRRQCNGKVLSVRDVSYSDGALSIRHPVTSWFAVRGDAGFVYDGEGGNLAGDSIAPVTLFYAGGSFSVDTRYFGLDVGFLAFSGYEGRYDAQLPLPTTPTGMIRIGSRNGFYISAHVMERFPLISGGGLGQLGVGFNLGRPSSLLWMGLGFGAYDAGLFTTRLEYPVNHELLLLLSAALGGSESKEGGMSVGVKFNY